MDLIETEGFETPVSVLQFFFNFCFYIFIVPFRFKWNHETKQYYWVCYKLHSIVCGYFHISVILNIFLRVCESYEKFHTQQHDSNDLSKAFYLVCDIASSCMFSLFIRLVWVRRNSLADIVNRTASTRKKTHFMLIGLITFTCLVFVIQKIYLEDLQAFGSYHQLGKNWNITLIAAEQTLRARLHMFIASQSQPIQILWNLTQRHVLHFYFLYHLFLFVLSCSVLFVAWNFQQELSLYELNVMAGTKAYRSLKQKMDSINNLFGGQILCFYVLDIAFYCELPKILIGQTTTNALMDVLMYFVFDTLTWIIAAESHSNVHQAILTWHGKCFYDVDLFLLLPTDLKGRGEWKDEMVKMERQMKLMSIKNELNSDPIAMSCRFFNVTNAFLNTMLGLLVTYGMISFQLGSS